mmetsp:Transcript_15532/g.28163  ORF Transcript_15532/g.28163 Transcript_15532/m.28163 type:complete len:333 (-) Transcript_15532:25-1023(-)
MSIWNRFSKERLRDTQEALLNLADLTFIKHRVEYGRDDYISAIEAGEGNVIVLLHGLGGGSAIYFKIMKILCSRFRVISVDLPGMGMSSRPDFDAEDEKSAEEFFMNPLQRLFEALNLNHFILWGHSFGGFIAGLYACYYPTKVEKLILVSTVGVASKPLDCNIDSKNEDYGFFLRGLVNTMTYLFEQNIISPSNVLSRSGPMSQSLLSSYMTQFLKHVDERTRDAIVNYLEMINLLPPSGEHALPILFKPGAWANNPLSLRLINFPRPILFVSGRNDWVTSDGGLETSQNSPYIVQVTIIDRSGHHLYIENPEELCNVVKDFIQNFSDPSI